MKIRILTIKIRITYVLCFLADRVYIWASEKNEKLYHEWAQKMEYILQQEAEYDSENKTKILKMIEDMQNADEVIKGDLK